jgi:hypothetical protein
MHKLDRHWLFEVQVALNSPFHWPSLWHTLERCVTPTLWHDPSVIPPLVIVNPHWPVLQQTPLKHFPELHWASVLHNFPFAFFHTSLPQTKPTHTFPES